jgi:hypothetical protein
MTDTTSTVAGATTKKVVDKVATTVADTNILPVVAEVTEVAVQVPSKFVVSSKLVLGVTAGVAVGAAGFYGVQKFREIRAKKKANVIVPTSLEDETELA